MSRARDTLIATAWWAVLAAALLWWLPTILGGLAVLLLDRARFRLALARVCALRLAGRDAAALRVLERAARRCELRATRVRGRRG